MKATDDPLTFIIALTFIVPLPIVRYCVMIDCDDIPSVLLQSYIRATLLRTLIAYALPMGTTHGVNCCQALAKSRQVVWFCLGFVQGMML